MLSTTGDREMPLQTGGANGYRYEMGVEFGMRDGPKTVKVRVSTEALQDREPTGQDLLWIFNKQRRAIEAAATRKYDAKEIEPDGIVYVRTADLNP
jgi:hypothetical protein